MFDTKGNPVMGKSFAWATIKRWAAEQSNVFLFSARVDGELVDLRLHCDDASAIANACNKGVKLAVAKHKEKQMKKRQLPTVVEERENEDSSTSEDDADAKSNGGAAGNSNASPKQVVLRPKVKLLYGRGKAAESKPPSTPPRSEEKAKETKPDESTSSTSSSVKKQSTPGTPGGTSELWAGHLREKAGSRFSIMKGMKKWWVLKANRKLRGYQIDPLTGKKNLQNIFTVVKCLSGTTATALGNKLITIDAIDESKPSSQQGSSPSTRQLQLEAESLDEADKLNKALVFCLSLEDAPSTPPAKPAVRQSGLEPSEGSTAKEEATAKEDEEDADTTSSEEEEEPEAEAEPMPSPKEEEEKVSPPKSNLVRLRQRNSLLGASPLLSDAMLGSPVSKTTETPVTPMKVEEEVDEMEEEEEEEEDSPIGKEIPDVRQAPPREVIQAQAAEGLNEMQQMLINQLAKRVDYLENELKQQKQSVQDVAAKQQEAMMRPPPAPVVAAPSTDSTMENFQQWGEIELLTTRMDRLEFAFEDLKLSFNAIVNDLTQNLMSIRDVLLVSSSGKT
ncbi:hypothetical protein A3770_18p82550 [Chloropicon primus]|uniref:PH domain-containing protein n=1 Tax=Chloropicon primus TaxID=1764295 RepID=A0A5B8MYS9_9CHLO|nr:hypothetical protein A3770_18p82550 [Chloropicon primus]|eukprot:QDZ25737.1 hypothetical protein A3770_18p82550 [Chloropicon primus]